MNEIKGDFGNKAKNSYDQIKKGKKEWEEYYNKNKRSKSVF